MTVKTYDMKKVICTFGPLNLTGFGEGDAIVLTPQAERFTVKKGCDGQTTRSRTNNDDYKAEITFMATSDARAKLQEMTFRELALSEKTYAFRLLSPATNEVYEANQCWVEKDPDASFGKEVGERKYTLYLPDCSNSVLRAGSQIVETLGSTLGFGG